MGNGIPPENEVDPCVAPWWKFWQRSAEWQDNLYRRAAHKALDIPDDEMGDITVRKGVGPLGLIGTAAVVGASVLGGMYLSRPQPAPVPQSPPVQSEPADSEYDVIFYDRHGNKIDVPHVRERKAK